ncbi:MAG TPA: glycosyltransferase family 2 protein, partial [Gemmatimonadales bacterium]|nr:glycosyltransferase family 2 protein [Gemmatimonadales bacterium]
AGEVVVADNGSTDGSQSIAERAGARVVPIAMRGYGSALMGGIAAARGRYVLMGDADDSYDFLESPRFLPPLRAGAELVQGCRLPSGGGTVTPGAMPFLHRWWGNPMFSAMARQWYGAPTHDIYCGMRAFRRELIERLDLRCTGMEYATEMIIKATIHGARIAEVPITLHPDGRVAHAPHLRTFRDGWRTLRFFLMYSPRWLFLVPGFLLSVAGLVCYVLVMGRISIGRIVLDAHTLLFGSLAIICGFQSVLFAVMTKVFAINERMLPMDRRLERAFQILNLERGLVLAAITMLAGLALLAVAIGQWVKVDFGHLDYSSTMRWVIPGVTLTTLGFQAILSGFFLSILGMRRR